MKRIFFVDIDGTIINCSKGLIVPSENTIKAFRKIRENGDYIFIASGRAKCLLPESVVELKPSGYVLANGAYAEINDEILFMDSMSLESKNKIIDFANRREGAYYLETVDAIYTRDLSLQVHKDYAEAWNVLDCYKDEGYSDNLDINIAMLAFDKDYKEEMYQELSPFVDVNPHNGTYSGDLNIKGVNKGTAVKRVCEMLNIDLNNSYAFGDGINDIEMMMAVKYSVAMNNACDELKNIASEVTDDVLEDGFYNYLIKNNIISE